MSARACIHGKRCDCGRTSISFCRNWCHRFRNTLILYHTYYRMCFRCSREAGRNQLIAEVLKLLNG